MNAVLSKVFIISGAMVMSGAMAMAQQNQPQQMPPVNQPSNNPAAMSNPNQQQQMQMEQQQNSDMSKMQDKAFLRKAAEGGMAEVQLGQLAQQKASSQDVRQFGEKMVQEHSQLNDQLKPIAEQQGVRPPKALSKKDEATLRKLEGLSGQQVDHAYIETMLKDHKKDLKEFKETANRTQNPQLKDAAQHGAQVIESHLQDIQQIAKSHNVSEKGA
jgi:putative membrane protein